MSPLPPILDWMHRHTPRNPGRFVMPYLVVVMTLIAVAGLVQGRQAHDLAERTQDVAKENRVLAKRATHLSQQLRHGLIANCKQLRATIQSGYIEDRNATAATPASLFKGFPKAKFDELIDKAIDRIDTRIAATDPKECLRQYDKGM